MDEPEAHVLEPWVIWATLPAKVSAECVEALLGHAHSTMLDHSLSEVLEPCRLTSAAPQHTWHDLEK